MDSTQKVLIGVSGGPDSLALADALHQLGWPMAVAHFDHRLRPESSADAAAVRQFAEARQLPFLLEGGEVAAYADAHQLSIEEAARVMRYRFLFEQAARIEAQAVIVAHTADDQVETVLMHLLRGAGLAGLRGMLFRLLPNPWSDHIPLVRPLLSTWRTEIEAYCEKRHLRPRFDRTNLDTTYFRNRLRHELLPMMEGYQPNLKQRLWQLAHLLAADYEALTLVVDAAWRVCLTEVREGCLSFDAASFQKQPLAVQRAFLRRAMASLRPGLRDVGFETIQRMMECIAHPPRKRRCEIGGGLRLVWEQGRLYLADWRADLRGNDFPQVAEPLQSLPIPGEIALSGGWHLTVAEIEPRGAYEAALQNQDPFQAWAAVSGPILTVRTARSGERFCPLGLAGHSLKLSDFWINVKVPQSLRANWPLVCEEDRIVWIAGLRLAHSARLIPTTRRAVHLSLRRV